MANLGLNDVLVRSENKTLLPIFNRLRQRNDIMSHLQWKEASHKTYHRFLHRSSEPSGSFVALGEGISGSRSEVGVVIEPMGVLKDLSEIPEDIVRVSQNPQQFRFDEDVAFLDGLAKKLVASIFYGSQASDPNAFNGLSTRYNLDSKFNVKDSGGSGTMSAWIIQHSADDGVAVIYPAGSHSAGITMRDRGMQYVDQSASNNARVFSVFTEFEFAMGLAVMDHRAALRYANIDTSSNTFTLTEFIDLCKEAWDLSTTRAYVNRTVWGQVQAAALAQSGNSITYPEDSLGRQATAIFGMPFHMVEQLGSEAHVA